MGQTDGMVTVVAAELGASPPFDRMTKAELEQLASNSELQYLEPGDVVFDEGTWPDAQFFLVRKGLVEIDREVEGARVPVAICDDGDIFGIRALMLAAAYSARARAKEPSLVYALPYPAMAEIMRANPTVSMFFAAGFAAELPPLRERLVQASREVKRAWSGVGTTAGLHVIRPKRPLVTCAPEASVKEVAGVMSKERIGSMVIVDGEGRAVGMLTDTDLRNRVVAEGKDASLTTVSEVMSTPVLTIEPEPTVEEITERIIREGARHFVVTEDGTPSARATAMVSEHDVLVSSRSVPSVIVDGLTGARDASELKVYRDLAEDLLRQYLEQQMSMRLVCAVLTKVNDALVERALELALKALPEPPPCRFCVLALGSEGREEQLLRTDQDNAIIFEDVADVEGARRYFVELGSRVVESLIAAGFARCPGDIMASNPEWVQSTAGWKRHFEGWVSKPSPTALMHANIFFDFRAAGGDPELASELGAWLVARVHEERAFFPFFAQSAQANPAPLSFFRGFLVERSGEHKDRFDIKARAMMGLCDAARVLSFDLRLTEHTNTAGRFRALSRATELNESSRKLMDEAADAYELFSRVRAEEGLRTGTSGRFVDIEALGKLERQALKNAFAIIEDLQLMLRQRYRTDFMR